MSENNGPKCKPCDGTGRMEIGNLLLSDPPQPMIEQDCPMCNGTGHYRGRMTALVTAIKGMADEDSETKISWMKSFIYEGEQHKEIAIEVWHEIMGPDMPCLLTLKPEKKKKTYRHRPRTSAEESASEPTEGPNGGAYRG